MAFAMAEGKHEKKALMRKLARNDLFFLLCYVLKRTDIDDDWLYDRCNEVQASPDGHLDLWAREHYKSTIITFALTIQDILKDPEHTFAIFSYNRPNAKKFMRWIKVEFEDNEELQQLFPEILWANPKRQAPKWSEDDGLVVKRKGNPKEATVEAHGLIESLPTGPHFGTRIYDDVVTEDSVSNIEMLKKVVKRWELSLNLGKRGGRERYIGTRYHFNDTYRTIIDRGVVQERFYPATHNGKVEGDGIFLTNEELVKKRREMGPYIFGCFVKDTPILMADWTEKPLSEVKPGDWVVGYTFGIPGQKARLVPSKVVACQSRPAKTVEFKFSSGRTLIGTRDHKFWHGRAERGYSRLGLKYGQLSGACSIYDPGQVDVGNVNPWAAGYLAGIIDGEGTVSGNTIHIYQDFLSNPVVCKAIETVLHECGFSFSVGRRPDKKSSRDYYLTGGREAKMRLARLMWGAGKVLRVGSSIYDNGTRNIGHRSSRDELVRITPMSEWPVYNIQTETGNYIANGYAVKNCQMLLDPKADEVQGFLEDWLRYWIVKDWMQFNRYIVVDPASEKKKENDYTYMEVIGLGADLNYYTIDMVRDRLNLTERAQALIKLHRMYRPITGVGYEKYGKDADIEHIQYVQEKENYRFEITALGGPMGKLDRIRRLIPIFEQGRWWMPTSLPYVDREKKQHDLVRDFIFEEYLAFPVGIHDDMLDGRARILDEDLAAHFPDPFADRPHLESELDRTQDEYELYA